MKKTAQTLLTAAIFATALGNSAQSHVPQPVQAAGDPIIELQTNWAGVYGPPPPQDTTLTTTTQTVYNIPAYPEHELPSTTTEDIIPQPAYGPPRTAFPGDTNLDAKADARDLTTIKRAAQFGAETVGYFEYDFADVNSDGVVDKEDVRIFMEEMLGPRSRYTAPPPHCRRQRQRRKSRWFRFTARPP